jgi:hypothetical protein
VSSTMKCHWWTSGVELALSIHMNILSTSYVFIYLSIAPGCYSYLLLLLLRDLYYTTLIYLIDSGVACGRSALASPCMCECRYVSSLNLYLKVVIVLCVVAVDRVSW